jgi:predicted Fe-Mo cluster-binding NifX family protein
MSMTLAIPEWHDQVSTTLDFAHSLLIVKVEGERELSRKRVCITDEPTVCKVRTLRQYSVDVVLCGALSELLAQEIAGMGIQIVPHVTGAVDDVLGAFLCGRLSDPRFMQPGCRPGARRRWRLRCHKMHISDRTDKEPGWCKRGRHENI